MGDRMRLEPQGAGSIEFRDLGPAEKRRLVPVPGERCPSVGYPGRDEDRGVESVFRQNWERMLGHIEIPVVEVEAHRPLQRLAGIQQVGDSSDVDYLVARLREIVHLLAELLRMDSELVTIGRDSVIEENSDSAADEVVTRPGQPECRPHPGNGCLDRVRKRWPDPVIRALEVRLFGV